MLSSYYTTTSIPSKYTLNEIEQYQTKIVTDNDRDECPLSYWNRNEKLLPKLSRIANELIPIPATSVKSEQNFSAAGRLINDRRTTIKSDHVDALLFVRSNISHLKH